MSTTEIDSDKENKRGQGGNKLGGDGKKQARETGGKMGSKEKPFVFLSSLSLLDDESYTSVIVPMKKSRGEKVDQQVGG